MECHLLRKPTFRGCIKGMINLLLNKSMFWVLEQRLVNKTNTILRNSWMTKLEIEELERTQLKMIAVRKMKKLLMIQVIT